MTQRGIDQEALDAILGSLRQFASRSLPLSWRLKADAAEEFPAEIIRELMGPEIGLHLIYIPEDCGGLGGGAFDIYRVSETMASIDLGLATAFLAGQATLCLLRCDRVCSTSEQIVFALGGGLSELSLATLALGLCGVLRQRWLFVLCQGGAG